MKKSDLFVVSKGENGEYNWIRKEDMDSMYAVKADMDYQGSKAVKDEEGWDYGNLILEPKFKPEYLVDLLDLNTYHEQCVDLVARDAAGKSYTFIPAEHENEEKQPPETVVNFFKELTTPINELFFKMNYDRRTLGYGCLEVIRESTNKSPIVNLAHIQAHTLRRASDGFRVQQRVGTKTVWFTIYGQNYDENNKLVDVHADTGDYYPFGTLKDEEKANEILWVMDYAPGTNYYGRPKAASIIPVIDNELSRTRYNNNFFKNYGMPSFAVTITGDFEDYGIDPEDEDYDITQTLKYRITEQLKKVIGNPHSAVVITIPSMGEEGNVDVKIQPLSVETKEASFRLSRQDNRNEIIHAHRVDPSRLGISETGKLNGSNSQNISSVYKVSTVQPVKADCENLMNTLLKKEFGVYDWVFSIVDADIKEYSQDIPVLKELFNMACITPRQIIKVVGEKYGLNANVDNPYLDEYYLNGTPLDTVWSNSGMVGDTSILDSLEEDLMKEADEFDDQFREEGQTDIDGFESKSSQKADASLHERISEAFNQRKKA